MKFWLSENVDQEEERRILERLYAPRKIVDINSDLNLAPGDIIRPVQEPKG